MAEVSPSPNKRGALRIGDAMLRSAKMFNRGIRSTFSLGRDVVARSSVKIASTKKKIKLERAYQDSQENKNRELAKRQKKEASLEGRKVGGAIKPITGVIKNALMKPIEAALRLLAAWAIDNLPLIIKKIKIFVKRLRIVGASINYMIKSVGGVFVSLVKISKAFLQNLAEFDFNDSKRRLERAQNDLDENIEGVQLGFEEIQNAWTREEAELDIMLSQLEDKQTLREAVNAVTPESLIKANTPAVGPGSSYSGPNEMYGMKIDAVTNTKWKPILNIIAHAESVGGSYSSAYPGKIIPGLENMTMEKAVKASGGMDSTGKHKAIGRYQFTRLTTEQAQRANLKPTDKFSPENQDKMAIALIEGKKGVSFDMLKNNPGRAQLLLSQEWAGLPKDAGNRSFYAGDGVNAARVDTQSLNKAFSSALTGGSDNKVEASPKEGVAQTQRPQSQTSGVGKATDSKGMTIGSNVLYAKDFNTKDYKAPSPIIKTSERGIRNGRMHQGVDFGTGGQSGWYCALTLDGVVSYVGYDGGGGNMVFIKSGGVEYVFMHLARYSPGIRSGSKYTAGQPIGEVGNTGRSGGIHLHFEMRKGNRAFDPNPYIKYVVFGKLKKTSKSGNTAMTGRSKERATEVASAAASNRTNTNQSQSSIIVIKQTERVIT